MAFDLHIKNIGKLTDAKIRIGRFTVFSGPNNTGKSFASKILYSIYEAMKINRSLFNVRKQVFSLVEYFPRLEGYSEEVDKLSSQFREETLIHLYELSELLSLVPGPENSDQFISEMVEHVKLVWVKFKDFRSAIDFLEKKEESRLFPFSFSEFSGRVEKIISELEVNVNYLNENKISYGVGYRIKANLIENFQVTELSELKTEKEKISEISGKYIGKIKLLGEAINFEKSNHRVGRRQQFSNVMYLESPIYWKLKNALETLAVYPEDPSPRMRINGIPGYFYDLANILKFQYTGDLAFPDVYEKLVGKEVLGGKISISESNDLSFQENGRSFSLPITAMGVTNLGILALLIERKILDKESFIFIDEPESNLHPAWQVVMAEALFELAKGGAHVVIATHSIDILKWLDVHIKKHPEDKKLVALNKFPPDGPDAVERDFDEKVAAIKEELAEPFADLYVEGLL